ncbi:MAG: ABC transporter permease subunit [Bradymonadia bacterium]
MWEKAFVYVTSLIVALGLAFFTLYLSPRDPANPAPEIGQSPGAHQVQVEGWAKAELVLDRVVAGEAYAYNRTPVLDVIVDRLPTTLAITIPGMLLGVLLGFLFGSAAARWRHRITGKMLFGVALVGVIVPSPVWVATARVVWDELIYPVMAWMGVSGGASDAIAACLTFALIAFPAIAIHQCAAITRALHQPDVQLARALKAKSSTLWRWLILPRSKPYWKTQLSLLCVSVFEGSLLIESAFNCKGLGLTSFDAVGRSDAALVLILVGLTCSLVNLGVLASGAATANDASARTPQAAGAA